MSIEDKLRKDIVSTIGMYPNSVATVIREATIKIEKFKIEEAFRNPEVEAIYNNIIDRSIEEAMEGGNSSRYRSGVYLDKWGVKAIVSKLEEVGFSKVNVEAFRYNTTGPLIKIFTIEW